MHSSSIHGTVSRFTQTHLVLSFGAHDAAQRNPIHMSNRFLQIPHLPLLLLFGLTSRQALISACMCALYISTKCWLHYVPPRCQVLFVAWTHFLCPLLSNKPPCPIHSSVGRYLSRGSPNLFKFCISINASTLHSNFVFSAHVRQVHWLDNSFRESICCLFAFCITPSRA